MEVLVLIMEHVYVIHYHEIALKGRNRALFLRQLQKNICRATKVSIGQVKIASGRLIVEIAALPTKNRDVSNFAAQNLETSNFSSPRNDIKLALRRVFGISSFASAVLVKADYDEIQNAIKTFILPSLEVFSTFAIAASRGDKQFAMTSHDLEVKLGDFIRTEFGKKVDLTHPEVTFYVEIFQGGALVYIDKIPGAGGLPVGTQPKVAVLLSGGIDSPVAAYRVMKRGAPVLGVHFHSHPFTSRASIDKVKELARILASYGGLNKSYLIPFADAQKIIVQKTAPKYRVLLYRRLMLRIAEQIAARENALGLATGESIGQVASQTIENLRVINAAAQLPVFRPLIGYDKEEIIAEAKKIGTFEISILPHDDCCTVFMPKNPATRARLIDVEGEEANIDIAALMRSTLAQCEEMIIKI